MEPSWNRGIEQMTLNEDAAAGRRTVLQRWRAGAANAPAELRARLRLEEIFIVEGDLADTRRRGGRWEAGAYAYRKPGMDHGPFINYGQVDLDRSSITPN
ncbi:hypothetical protein F5X96DRAFT_671444 [Biscogniauxia mediterranea]|nr:hypothetical protein F5X96DRAFT_671444 [Biscogniauxia mediterranea]